jgi:hypothetical protein
MKMNININDFAEDVTKSMIKLLKNPDLGENLLESAPEDVVKHTVTLITCIAEAADLWFYSKASPKTIMYAVFISTVHEYIMDNVKKHQSRAFWAELAEKLPIEKDKIQQSVDKVKNNDKINIDEYHEMFRGDLNVSTQ